MYSVKEIFYTIQGEGLHSGCSAVFCRFSGCNLWSGREKHRANALCTFCDTHFVGTDGSNGGKYDLESLAERIDSLWPASAVGSTGGKFLVFTGGEPLLQLDTPLIQTMKERGFYISIETNGTQPLSARVDWVCVSPKTPASTLKITTGDELKFVYPQQKLSPEEFIHLPFSHFTLQPMDAPNLRENMTLAFEYCQKDPRWRLGLQMHKILGCP